MSLGFFPNVSKEDMAQIMRNHGIEFREHEEEQSLEQGLSPIKTFSMSVACSNT